MGARLWSSRDLDTVRSLYSCTPTKEIARIVGRSASATSQAAFKLGLGKSENYLASPASGRLRCGETRGGQHRFPRGHVPYNKGMKRPGWAPGRMAQSQFQAGNKPQTWLPVGTIRLTKDGYQERKVADTGCKQQDWVGLHTLLWQESHGPVPRGYAVIFRDGDKKNVALENLECLSRADLMRRNSVQRLPTELRLTIHLNGVLKRKLRSISEKQNDRPSQPSL